MAISERDIFLNINDFASTVTFTPAGGDAVSLDGLWWSPGEVVQVGEVDVVLTDYMIELPTEQVEGVAVNSTIVKDGVTYYCIEFLPDGNGFTKIKLSKDQA